MSEAEHPISADSDSSCELNAIDESIDSASDSEVEIELAPPPFDDPSADIVLRTCDGVDFYVFSWILREASPVFANMLAFPQPRKSESTSHPLDDASAELPIVDLPENSDTMEALLRLSYPRPTFSTFWTFDCAAELLEAAHKYELTYAEATLKQAIAPFIRDQPIQVYAFAARFRMTDLMEATAHACLALPFFWAYIPELENISAGAYHRLLDYRERCKVALGTISHTQWSVKDHRWTWRVCTTCVKHTSSRHVATGACGKCGQATWFSSFWNDVMARLKERPSVVTLLDQTLYDVPSLKKALDCATCRMVMYEQIRKFLALLADEAAKKISEVRLEIK